MYANALTYCFGGAEIHHHTLAYCLGDSNPNRKAGAGASAGAGGGDSGGTTSDTGFQWRVAVRQYRTELLDTEYDKWKADCDKRFPPPDPTFGSSDSESYGLMLRHSNPNLIWIDEMAYDLMTPAEREQKLNEPVSEEALAKYRYFHSQSQPQSRRRDESDDDDPIEPDTDRPFEPAAYSNAVDKMRGYSNPAARGVLPRVRRHFAIKILWKGDATRWCASFYNLLTKQLLPLANPEAGGSGDSNDIRLVLWRWRKPSGF